MASSTITSWALLIWQALQDSGHDARKVFSDAGANPAKLNDSNARYDVHTMYRLWQGALEISNDSCFGITVGKSWNPTTFHALGFAWLASASLKDGFERFVRYSRLINDSLQASLHQQGTDYHFALFSDEQQQNIHRIAIDAGNAAMVKMCRALLGDDFSPLRLEVDCPPSDASMALETYIGCGIDYDCTSNVLIIDGPTAEQHLPGNNPELVQVNEEVVKRYISTINKTQILPRIQAALVEMLPSGKMSEQHMAAELNMSVRSLQRKLAQKGTSYNTLLNNVRQDLAKNMLHNSRLSLGEIAYLLGFSEQANFTRAFRRWYGTSPSAYRQAYLAGTQNRQDSRLIG